jgi:hypothetical protein
MSTAIDKRIIMVRKLGEKVGQIQGLQSLKITPFRRFSKRNPSWMASGAA